MDGKDTHIEELVVELTGWCPLRCRHCSSDSGPECANALSPKVIDRLLSEAIDLGVRQVSFGGGEPTASAQLVPAIRRLARARIPSEIYSCGLALHGGRTRPLPASLMRELAEVADRVSIVFSIHGASASVHDGITSVEGSHEALLASARSCLSAGISTSANFVPLKPNLHEFEHVVDLVAELGMPKLSVLRFVPQGRGDDGRASLEPNREEEDRFVERLLAVRDTCGIEVRTGSPFNGIVPDNDVPCRAAISKLVIQPDGNVIPCEVFKHRSRKGWEASIYDSSLVEILDSHWFAALRRRLVGAGCSECPVHSHLRSSCHEQLGV